MRSTDGRFMDGGRPPCGDAHPPRLLRPVRRAVCYSAARRVHILAQRAVQIIARTFMCPAPGAALACTRMFIASDVNKGAWAMMLRPAERAMAARRGADRGGKHDGGRLHAGRPALPQRVTDPATVSRPDAAATRRWPASSTSRCGLPVPAAWEMRENGAGQDDEQAHGRMHARRLPDDSGRITEATMATNRCALCRRAKRTRLCAAASLRLQGQEREEGRSAAGCSRKCTRRQGLWSRATCV